MSSFFKYLLFSGAIVLLLIVMKTGFWLVLQATAADRDVSISKDARGIIVRHSGKVLRDAIFTINRQRKVRLGEVKPGSTHFPFEEILGESGKPGSPPIITHLSLDADREGSEVHVECAFVTSNR